MDIASFLHLLSVVSCRVIVFFGPDELVKLELACPKRELNDQIKLRWANNTIQGLVYSKRSASWIYERKVYPTKVLVDQFLTELDIILFSECSINVCEIDYRGAIFNNDQFMKLIKHCATITKFGSSPRMGRRPARNCLTAVDYAQVTESCPDLTDLSIQLYMLHRLDFRVIISYCPKLEAINTNDTYGLATSQTLEDLAEFCPNLKAFVTKRFQPLGLHENFLSLAEHFPQMNNVHIQQHFASIDAKFLKMCPMFVNCVPLLELRLGDVSVSDATFQQIVRFSPQLRVFCNVSAITSLPRLANLITRCVELRELNIMCLECDVANVFAALAERCTSLQALSLHTRRSEPVEGLMLESVPLSASWANMRRLMLGCCKIFSVSALRSMVQHAGRLTHLQLGGYRHSTAELCEILSHCPQLQSFWLYVAHGLADEALADGICAHLRRLKHLRMYGVDITDAGLVQIFTALTHLQNFDIGDIRHSTVRRDVRIVQGIEQHCHALRQLNIHRCSQAVQRELVRLQDARASQNIDFEFESVPEIHPVWRWLCVPPQRLVIGENVFL